MIVRPSGVNTRVGLTVGSCISSFHPALWATGEGPIVRQTTKQKLKLQNDHREQDNKEEDKEKHLQQNQKQNSKRVVLW